MKHVSAFELDDSLLSVSELCQAHTTLLCSAEVVDRHMVVEEGHPLRGLRPGLLAKGLFHCPGDHRLLGRPDVDWAERQPHQVVDTCRPEKGRVEEPGQQWQHLNGKTPDQVEQLVEFSKEGRDLIAPPGGHMRWLGRPRRRIRRSSTRRKPNLRLGVGDLRH